MIGCSQIFHVSLMLLLLFQMHIYTEKGGNFQPRKRVWLHGEIEYFSTDSESIRDMSFQLYLDYRVMAYLGLDEQIILCISWLMPVSHCLTAFKAASRTTWGFLQVYTFCIDRSSYLSGDEDYTTMLCSLRSSENMWWMWSIKLNTHHGLKY